MMALNDGHRTQLCWWPADNSSPGLTSGAELGIHAGGFQQHLPEIPVALTFTLRLSQIHSGALGERATVGCALSCRGDAIFAH